MLDAKELILLRGLPGSGKTEIAKLFYSMTTEVEQICADDCWETPYTAETFTSELHGKAHGVCFMTVKGWMYRGVPVIIVHNTFTTDGEMKPYLDSAKECGYRVHTLIVENRHGAESVHGVPTEVIAGMKKRFSIQLGGE